MSDAGAKVLRRILALKEASETYYRQNDAEDDARNISYYRGDFWEGDGHGQSIPRGRNYRATRNEVFPVLDTITSSLAMDLPQVEAIDMRAHADPEQTRSSDPTYAGRRIATVLNWIATEDELDQLVREWVLHAMMFRKGGIAKTSWSVPLSRPITRLRMPWEVFIDPIARNIRDASWIMEKFTLHWSDFEARLKSGVYEDKRGVIKPDVYPRAIISDTLEDAKEREYRRAGMREYVGLLEFWDFRRETLYHVHPGTKQIVMAARVPYGRPYTQLVFNPAVGRAEGVSDCTLIAPIQRDINELVSARREVVARLPRRMLVDEGLFRSDTEFNNWKDAKTWEPTRVRWPSSGTIDDRVWVSPEMPTTFDFRDHLADSIDSARHIPGVSEYQRGAVSNIRTAEEATMIRGAIEGRMGVKARTLTRGVKQIFDRTLEVMRWALHHPIDSTIDINELAAATVTGIAPAQLAQEILSESVKFRLMPFSPIMEDKSTRRNTLSTLLPVLPPTWLDNIDPREAMREIVDLYDLRPSMILSEEEIAEQQQAAAPEGMGMPGMEGMLPMEGAPPMPPGAEQGLALEGGPPPGLVEALQMMSGDSDTPLA